MLTILPFLLMGCEGLTNSIDGLPLDGPPVSLTEQCDRPVTLPDRTLTQVDVEQFWIQDRSNLITCGDRHSAVIDFYSSRDGLISQ